ncbi:Virulence sensor protein BvgS [Pseudomonas reidholzensis]|uniref:histidine kinase n=1 Tax=Pseudomonas reidholzensis TaxID=1785162 RepID=A0A383RR65_9PSED|nr:transporter substrate-binding domain-containing protein [Pseudomonas reidholzensis]SYX89385.1 Virulence sensor protein BvgS [Pseudomonas reidholzensis]
MLHARVLLLLCLVLCLPLSAAAASAPALHARASLAGPHAEPPTADLRWLWAHRQLRLGVLARDNPPYDILGTGQAYEGISADYAGLVAEHLRLAMSVQVFASFEQAAEALRAGAIDLLASVSRQQARAAGLQLSRAYGQDQPLLMAADHDGQPLKAASEPFTLVMVDGYRPLQEVSARYPMAQVQLHPSTLSAFAALALGQAELYLGDALSGRYVRGRNPPAGTVELGPARWPEDAIGFALRHHDSPLARLVDAALAAIDERQHAQIRERWSPLAAQAAEPRQVQLSDAEQRWLQHNPSITVLVDEQRVPLSYRDGKAQLRGLSLDVLQVISRRTGLHFQVEAGGSLERMLGQLGNGQARLIAGVPRSPALERSLVFSRAYLSAPRVLVTRDEPQAPASLEQLAGERLAVVWGSAVQATLPVGYPQVRLQAVAGPVAALHAVARGQVRAAVLTLDDARPLIARWYPGRLRISASLPLAPAHFALASARGEAELQSILNKALLSLAPHESDLLMRRWRNPLIVAEGAWPRYRNKVLLGFAVAVVLLSLALMWIRYLRRLQVRLRQATVVADTANQAKTQFLTTMSHEIRTPLHAMLGMLELAQHKAGQGVFDPLAVEVAAEAARGLLELIGDILDITRIEAGQLHLAPQRVGLRDQVARVVQLFEQQARGKGLQLRLQTHGAVDVEVLLDPLRFKQVLANLLSNAIKFTRQGGVEVSLRAVPGEGQLAVEVQVKDSGIGIAEADLAALGQPFRQASNQQQSPRCSAGLGLGISRSLCEMMGGRLSVRSVLGQGTEVSIRLSLALLSPTPAPAAAAPAPQAQASQAPLRVLVVDDYPASRLLLAQQLDYLGHQVRVAEDGAQALRLWLTEPFAVVISDCNMPRLNGHALARAIREHERRSQRPACRLIGLTANAQAIERRRCRASGMDACLFKPLRLDSLVQALASSAPVMDVEYLQRLVGDDRAGLLALLGSLRSSNRSDLQRLEQLVEDVPALAELAHRVKGGARIARAEELAGWCERVERSCAREPPLPEQLREDVCAMADAMRRLEHSLDQQVAQGVAQAGAP